MNIPENIFAEISCENCDDLSNVIIQLKVKAGRKNPFYITFPKTDASGKTSINRNDFIGQFRDHWEMGLMDYDGTPETANPIVEVSLFDPTWLTENKELAMAWPLLKYEETKWSNRKQKYEYMTMCENLKYYSQSMEIDLSKTDKIKFRVYEKR